MWKNEKNSFSSSIPSLSYLFWCPSFIPQWVIGWFLSFLKKSISCLPKSCECFILVMRMWWREKVCCRNVIVWKREEKGEKENVLSKDFFSKKDFRQNGRMFSSEGERWWTIFFTWQGLSKWGWSVCFLGSFALHMTRMMFDEKGKRFFFFPVDCDRVYCCEHTEWSSRCLSTDVPPNNLSQSFFEQKNLFLFSEKMKMLWKWHTSSPMNMIPTGWTKHTTVNKV